MKTLLQLVILLFLTGCSKSSGTESDRTIPIINLNTPLANQIFTNGQTVIISGTVTDNATIAEVHLVVTDMATGTIYVHAHVYPAAGSTDFNQPFTVKSGTDYKVEIIAIDRSLNQAVKSVQISCQ